jgi:hypothetical protein
MAQAKTDPTRIDDPSKASSNWLSIVEDVFPRWRDRLGSSKDAKDELKALLCDPETRSAKRRVNASGEEIPSTSSFVDTWFWRDRARLLAVPDADGGGDHLVVEDSTDYVDVYLPDGHWEFYARVVDVERWERLSFPMIAASTPTPRKERKLAPKKKRRKTKQAPRAGAPEQHDWEEGKLFVMQEFKTRGNPLDKNNQTEGWKSISDVARLLIDHLEKLSKDGIGPEMSTARGKVSGWIKEFERKRS